MQADSRGRPQLVQSWREIEDRDPVGPLWRAAQIFRLLSFVYALGFQIAINGDLTRPGLTWTLFGILTAANIWWAAGYLVGFGRRPWFVAVEVAVSAGMMLSTPFVTDNDWISHNQTWPTTLWMTNAALSTAVIGGTLWGAAAALAIAGANYYVKGEIYLNFGRNATTILLVSAAAAVGMAASRARTVHGELVSAIALAARSAERDRLSREVHDGVLQVLALMAKRGREIGGDAAELAELAAEQERRLRTLIADEPDSPNALAPSSRDLAAALRSSVAHRAQVSAPADPVTVDAHIADELLAAVDNILDNVAHHAGPGAEAFILLEDLGDEVIVSVRDDGVGIPDGRLAAAEAEGRLGISQSVIGRVEALGGTARLESAPDAGTEWELSAPKHDGKATP
ncbi:MacS family sensor histidine kinase [Gordonia malaquae]|uniref:MacS family sensor histidine kinase n=1 Tax=Gordonia malaquae TaxID=410332 RepID=UPI0030FEEDF1